MTKAIVFYCKNCDEMFFAAVNRPEVIEDSRKDINKYLKQGHRMSEVDTEEIRVTLGRCICNEEK